MDPTEFVTTEEAARTLNVPVDTLRQWRSRHTGPRYYKLGRAVRYNPADLAEWVAEQVVEPA